MNYRAEIQRFFIIDDELSVSRSETFSTWKEAQDWLDEQRTDISRYLSQWERDPYRYVLRIEA
jgi:hypothetical protein